ncbi:MAG: hypothetical protein DRN16_00605 [Thermoplasmata archaeon]|nr:MAG: hypothetical protein DRN16_00605 [Thermoplasmata archaeon]
MMLLDIEIHWEFISIIYFGTLCIYNYDYVRSLHIDYNDNTKRVKHIQKYLSFRLLVLIIYGSIFFSFLIYFSNFQSIIFGTVLLLIGLLYTDVFKRGTKKFVGFKNIYTSLCFSMLLLFVPVYYSYKINMLFLVFFVFILLQFIVDTSFCDLKDMYTDKKQDLKTLPLYFGKQKFLLFLHILNAVSFLMLSVAIATGVVPLFSLILLLFFLYRFYYINKAKESTGSDRNIQKLYAFVDGEYFFWPLVLSIGKYFMITLM